MKVTEWGPWWSGEWSVFVTRRDLIDCDMCRGSARDGRGRMTREHDYQEGGQLHNRPRRLGLLIACSSVCAHLADGTLPTLKSS